VCTITDMQVEIETDVPTIVAGTPGDGLIKIADLATPKVQNVLISNIVGRVTYATPPTGVVGINATNQPAGRIHVMGDSFAVAGIANPVVRTAAVTNLAGTGIYGTTSLRPGATSVPIGQHYFDTTLGYEIHSDGTNWVDSAGATV
jgi:hypothetical protein